MGSYKVVVGICEDEVFIADVDVRTKSPRRKIDGSMIFDVLRYVDTDDLEDRRDPDEIKEYVRELWQETVMAGRYEGSLNDYVEEVMQECDMEYDEEAYPGKDDSWCDELTPDLREAADDFLLEHSGIHVGTWEASGCYEPKGKFDFVFDDPEAQEIAALFAKEKGF